jgi:hypothetical protein
MAFLGSRATCLSAGVFGIRDDTITGGPSSKQLGAILLQQCYDSGCSLCCPCSPLSGYEAASHWPQEHNVPCPLWFNGKRFPKYVSTFLLTVFVLHYLTWLDKEAC